MDMAVKLSLSPDHTGEWLVSLDEVCIVRFSGPSALQQAIRRSRELGDLLHQTVDISEAPPAERAWPFRTLR
jgi:hypothetical protein